MKYDIEISGSITIHKKANTRAGIIRQISRAQGRISIIDTHENIEVYFGNAEDVRKTIKTEINYMI